MFHNNNFPSSWGNNSPFCSQAHSRASSSTRQGPYYHAIAEVSVRTGGLVEKEVDGTGYEEGVTSDGSGNAKSWNYGIGGGKRYSGARVKLEVKRGVETADYTTNNIPGTASGRGKTKRPSGSASQSLSLSANANSWFGPGLNTHLHLGLQSDHLPLAPHAPATPTSPISSTAHKSADIRTAINSPPTLCTSHSHFPTTGNIDHYHRRHHHYHHNHDWVQGDTPNIYTSPVPEHPSPSYVFTPPAAAQGIGSARTHSSYNANDTNYNNKRTNTTVSTSTAAPSFTNSQHGTTCANSGLQANPSSRPRPPTTATTEPPTAVAGTFTNIKMGANPRAGGKHMHTKSSTEVFLSDDNKNREVCVPASAHCCGSSAGGSKVMGITDLKTTKAKKNSGVLSSSSDSSSSSPEENLSALGVGSKKTWEKEGSSQKYLYQRSLKGRHPLYPGSTSEVKIDHRSDYYNGRTAGHADTEATPASEKVKPVGTAYTKCGALYPELSSGEHKERFSWKDGRVNGGISAAASAKVGEAEQKLKGSKGGEKREKKEEFGIKEKTYRGKKKEKQKKESPSSPSPQSSPDLDSESNSSPTRKKQEVLQRKLRRLKGEVGKDKTFRVVGENMSVHTASTATSEGIHIQSGVDIFRGAGWGSEDAGANFNAYGSVGDGGGDFGMSASVKVDGDAEKVRSAGEANGLWEEVLPPNVNPGVDWGGVSADQVSVNAGKYGKRILPLSPTSKVPPGATTNTHADSNIRNSSTESWEGRTEANGTSPPAVPPKVSLRHHHNGGEKLNRKLQNMHMHEESSSSSGEGMTPGPRALVLDTHSAPSTSADSTGDARAHIDSRNQQHNRTPTLPQATLPSLSNSNSNSTSQSLTCTQSNANQCAHPHCREYTPQQQQHERHQCTHTYTHMHNPDSEVDHQVHYDHIHTHTHDSHDHGDGFCSYTYIFPGEWDAVQVTTTASWVPVVPVATMWGGWGWEWGGWYAP